MKDGDAMLNKVLFTLSSTSWIFVIYGISEEVSFVNDSKVLTGIVLLLIPLLLTLVWLINAVKFSAKERIQGDCQEIEEANNDFLANYLGYFFIGIGLEKFETLITIYVIMLQYHGDFTEFFVKKIEIRIDKRHNIMYNRQCNPMKS